MDNQQGEGLDAGGSFGVQSVDDMVVVPATLVDWVIAWWAVHDTQCVDQVCFEACSKVNSLAECNNICISQQCEELVEELAHNPETHNTATQAEPTVDLAPGFNTGRRSWDSARNAAINQQTAVVWVNTTQYMYRIDSNHYNAQCVQAECKNLCDSLNKPEAFCNSACVGKLCLEIKAKGNLENYRIPGT